MKFDPEQTDERVFYAARAALLAQFDGWAAAAIETTDSLQADVGTFLEWRYQYSNGDLGSFTRGDVEEYLLEWCPRKLSYPPDAWLGVVEAVRSWLLFVYETGKWDGPPVTPLLRVLDEITPDFLGAMSEPTNFGLAKGLFTHEVFADVDMEDPASLQAAMDAFNALPFEERAAAADGGLGPAPNVVEFERIELAPTPLPDEARAAEEAADAPIVRQVAAIVEFLGAGRALTQKGNLKIADARELLALVPTDDRPDHRIGDREYKLRSSEDLHHLTYLLDAAKEAGAIRVHGKKLVGVKAFGELTPREQIDELFDAMIELGPIFGRGVWGPADQEAFIEDGAPHYLLPVFTHGEFEVEEIVGHVLTMVRQYVPTRLFAKHPDMEGDAVEREVERVIDVFVRCGLMVRHDERRVPERYTPEITRPSGGRLVITELGRSVMPRWLDVNGYLVSEPLDVAGMTAGEMLVAVVADGTVDSHDAFNSWEPERSSEEKAFLLATAMVEAPTTAAERAVAAAMLDGAGDAAVPALREVVADSYLRGYAAAILLERGEMDDETLPDVDRIALIIPMIDMLAVAFDVDDPDEVAAVCEEMVGGNDADEAEHLIDGIWRIDLPETSGVLDTIGRHHPDRRVAKAAIRHRSKFPGS